MKKTKKSTSEIIASVIAIVFGALMILPFFISVISMSSTVLGGELTSYTIFTLGDIVSASGNDITAFATVIEIFALIAIISSLAMVVLELLKLIGINFPRMLRALLAGIAVIASIATFVMLIILASSSSADNDIISKAAKYVVSAGGYLLLVFGIIGGTAGIIANRK